ncbi:MAG: DinB family protein [Bacteroidia bacterium]
MSFNLSHTIEILERTPKTLHALLYNNNDFWTNNNEGGETWSPYDVVGHLIHCDESNWIPRIEIVISNSVVKKFEPLDRLAQFTKYEGKNINNLLDVFVSLRSESITKLKSFRITEEQLQKTAIHPELGSVTLAQLISTWAVHDLDHLSQITRVMAKQYKSSVGPWVQYMRVLKQEI